MVLTGKIALQRAALDIVEQPIDVNGYFHLRRLRSAIASVLTDAPDDVISALVERIDVYMKNEPKPTMQHVLEQLHDRIEQNGATAPELRKVATRRPTAMSHFVARRMVTSFQREIGTPLHGLIASAVAGAENDLDERIVRGLTRQLARTPKS